MKSKFLIFLICLLLTPMTAFAGWWNTDSSNECETRNPIVLAHGMGASAEVLGIADYWWGIEDALENKGGKVYTTSVNAMDSTRNKAKDFASQVRDIIATTPAEKVNIIAHSHGGLYARDAITNCDLASKVASLTTIGTPHRGSSVADLIVHKTPDVFRDILGDSLDLAYAFVLGDSDPDSLQNGYDLCTDYMQNTFNPETPNVNGVYYQSYAGKNKWSAPNLILEPTWIYMESKEGDN
ncbi:MAG: esterase/lipase family protein, partial [Thermodesulfobacteriota bacterium]